jgi:hypothetical protein
MANPNKITDNETSTPSKKSKIEILKLIVNNETNVKSQKKSKKTTLNLDSLAK